MCPRCDGRGGRVVKDDPSPLGVCFEPCEECLAEGLCPGCGGALDADACPLCGWVLGAVEECYED